MNYKPKSTTTSTGQQKWMSLLGGQGTPQIQQLTSDFEQREAGALAANKAREQEIRGIYASILGQGDSAARTAGLSEIGRQERQATGQATQQLISSGLFGTTTAASVPIQTGRVAAEQRLRLEDVLQQRKSAAQQSMAGFLERIEQPYPDYSTLIQAMTAAYSK